jgi:phosphoribosyl 1,2-cyclic phosphodiesterase
LADDSAFRVRFWGVRGSVACAGPDYVRYGGNTACVEMECGRRRLIFDAGTGLRALGNALAAPVEADVFFSHTHWDHIVGLPFFRPAYDPQNRFVIRGGRLARDITVEQALRQAMSTPLFPVPFDIFRAHVTVHDFTAGTTLQPYPELRVRTAALNHPGGSTAYRVDYGGKSVCYVTDTEHTPGKPDQRVLALIAGADIVIYDATYTDEELPRYTGWGHSTWQEGVRLCRTAGARRLVLFHHDPIRDDRALAALERQAAEAFPGTVAAREGLTLTP